MNAPPSNAFGFPASSDPTESNSQAASLVKDDEKGDAALPIPPDPSPREAGDQAREQAGEKLRRLVWEFPNGSRRVPLLTSSRWCVYEALRSRIGADDAVIVVNPRQAHASAYSRRFLDSSLLLFLCLSPASTWEQPRTVTHNGRTIELEPLAADFGGFLNAWRRWTDESIPIPRLDDAVTMAESLVSLTFSALAVRSSEEDEAEDETAEKKTQSPGGTTDTSVASVAP
jgi:hypothetical protein